MRKGDRFQLLLAGVFILGISWACGASAGVPLNQALATPDINQLSNTEESSALATQAPTAITSFVVQSTPTEEQHPSPEIIAPPPAILESRRVTLEYPAQIRTGDSDVIRLTLEVDTLGNLTPTAMVQGNLITGQIVKIPNLFDTHNVIAEAQLDLAGLEVRPSEAISEPLVQGQSVTFYWSVLPANSGMFRGTAWLFLRFVDKVSGAESRIPISAQPVQIESTNFLGLTGSVARTAGGIGSVVGAVLGFPFATDIIKWLIDRLKSRN